MVTITGSFKSVNVYNPILIHKVHKMFCQHVCRCHSVCYDMILITWRRFNTKHLIGTPLIAVDGRKCHSGKCVVQSHPGTIGSGGWGVLGDSAISFESIPSSTVDYFCDYWFYTCLKIPGSHIYLFIYLFIVFKHFQQIWCFPIHVRTQSLHTESLWSLWLLGLGVQRQMFGSNGHNLILLGAR